MDISIIIPNYQSEHYLPSCINSLLIHMDNKMLYEIIVINNDLNKISTISANENIRVIENNNNDGFAKACNKGAAFARGKVLFFLNPDTKFESGNIADLINAFSDSTVGIVSPQLLTPNNRIQPWSSGYKITLLEIILNKLGLVRSKKLWQKNTSAVPAWISGAAMAINKNLFEKIKGFDENFFMYFEDVDLCKRVADESLTMLILPSVQILHLGGQSFSSSIQQKKYYYASQDYYFKKHFSLFSVLMLKIFRSIFLFFKKV